MAKTNSTVWLKAGEWLSETAFLPSGFHRLLTAGGLSLGLYGGRKTMDVVTAKNSHTEQDIKRESVNPLLRPLYGAMTYNPYSDNATDRWKSVADKTVPLVLGATGAYLGSKHFFYGRGLSFKGVGPAFNHSSRNAIKQTQAVLGDSEKALKKFTVDVADTASNIAQSDHTSRLAAGSFAVGGDAGTHLFGAFLPINNGMSSIRFQQIVRHVNFPFSKTLNRWLGNRGNSSLKYRSTLTDLSKWAESNTLKGLEHNAWANEETRHHFAENILQIFKQTNKQDEKHIASMIKNVLDDGQKLRNTLHHAKEPEQLISAKLKTFYDSQFLGVGLEKNLIKHGFKEHLAKAAIGDSGPFSFFSRLLGSAKKERIIEQKFRDHLKQTHPETYGDYDFGKSHIAVPTGKIIAASAAGLAITGAAASAAHKTDQESHLSEAVQQQTNDPNSRVFQASQFHEAQKNQHRNIVGWINNKPLESLHWLSNVTVAPPSLHRLMGAACLSLGLWGGMKGANILTGRNLKLTKGADSFHSSIDKKNVFAPLRPLHGLLEYTPGAHTTKDRWRQAAHHLMPVITGAAGTYLGSKSFFTDRQQEAKQAEYLEDYADSISLEQSHIYGKAMAATSIFNTGAGLHLLPVVNYSSNLHNRYLMASGHQVAMPGLGKWWSGNPGLYPWGVKKTLHYMVKYLSRDDAEFPKQLPALTHAVLAKLYPDMPAPELAKKEVAFMEAVYTSRDPYLKEHALDLKRSDSLEKALSTQFTGAGLEKTLRAIGLKPEDANLSSNGASGRLSERFSSKANVKKLEQEYREKALSRANDHHDVTLTPKLAPAQNTTPTNNINTNALKHEQTVASNIASLKCA